MFTYEQLQDLVPKKQRNVISEDLVALINDVAEDETIGEEFKQNRICVMDSGRVVMFGGENGD